MITSKAFMLATMQVMHIENDSIEKYIRSLEEAQQQSARVGVPITKSMIATHWFPATDEKWEEIERYAQTWGKWKDLYKKAEKQSRVKRWVVGGQDQFEEAVLEACTGGSATPGGRVTSVTIDELEVCFDNLATVASTGTTPLDELINNNSTLTSSIAELAATNT